MGGGEEGKTGEGKKEKKFMIREEGEKKEELKEEEK